MAKKKDINLSDLDANFVISSFKNKERRNNPSAVPKALVPEQDAIEDEEEIRIAVVPVVAPHEEPKRKRGKLPDYESLFIQEAGITARTGKSVYIRKEHHERITRIVQVIGKNQVSLFSYIDQVLTHHFATYQNEIKELYEKYNENIF